jgi:FixJ family two-component response regulator
MTDLASIVYVIDDDPSIRRAIKRLVGSVGLETELFGSAKDFLVACRPNVPSCMILDVRLPGMSGIDFQHELLEARIYIPIIFITSHGDIPMSVRAMKRGAVEFLPKPFRDQELHQSEIAEIQKRVASLTPRERQVLPLVVSGLPNKRIADVIGTSETTVKVHRSQLTRKMSAKSFADLVRMAEKVHPTTNLGRGNPS